MGDLENLGSGEKEALVSARLGDLRKKVNAESWSDNMELLMKAWGEKAAGLRFMHAHSGGKWKNFANRLAITGIVITGLVSTVSLVATSVDDENTKNGLLFGVGGVGLVSTLIQAFKKFYNSEEKAADHSSVSKQFGSFYRYMTLQMGMSREDRDPSDILTSWALKEYERLQQEAPSLDGKSVELFKKTFNDSEQAIPDIAEDKFIIKILKTPKPLLTVKQKDKSVKMMESATNEKVNNVVDAESSTTEQVNNVEITESATPEQVDVVINNE